MAHNTSIAPLSTLRPDPWSKSVPYEAARFCSAVALSPATRDRDALLDRLDEMSSDELAECAFAARYLA